MSRKIILLFVVLVYLAFQGCSVAEDLEDGMEPRPDWLSPWPGREQVNDIEPRPDWLSPWPGRVQVNGVEADPGLAGMIQWLRQPVPRYPWYTTDDPLFYRQPVPEIAYSNFTRYYVTLGTPEFQDPPSVVYFASGAGLPYSQYRSTIPSETNTLWIQGGTDWTQYVACPLGTMLNLIAYTPVEAPAGIYETIQTETTGLTYRVFQLEAGYNILNFHAEQIGRHMLYFVVDNQPSNVVIIDVFPHFGQDQMDLTPPDRI